MYSREQLERFPFFRKELSEAGLDHILDTLTGVVSRGYILEYVKALIAEGTPFSFAMLDLDNFKFINDTYGHRIGDAVLKEVAGSLSDCLGERGVVGRFGGDEFLFVDLVDLTYDEKKAFIGSIYSNERVLRKNLQFENCSPFITATVGCASFPSDAADYDTLFGLIDKTLYRGKTKGRNCHIIYVEEKHKNIQITKLARHGIYTSMHSLIRQFELVPTIQNKLSSVLPFLMEELRISDMYVVDASGLMYAIRNKHFSETVTDLGKLCNDDLFSTNQIDEIAERCPVFYEILKRHEIETFVAVRVGMEMETNGYLVCAEDHNRRIWQEDECAILYFLAKLLAARIRIDHEDLSRNP